MTTTTSRPCAASRERNWRWIRSLFPLHLDALARKTGAAVFWRNVPSAQVLVRMLLLWSLCGWGLRSVAAWAHRAGWAHLTADSLRYRFAQCEDFLLAVLRHVLHSWVRVERADGVPLRLVDASMLAVAGPSGRVFRVHAVYDPRAGRLTHVEVTNDKEGESLQRGPHRAGDLLIADRGHAHVQALLAVCARKVYWIVRAYLNTIKLFDAQGARVDRQFPQLCALAQKAGGVQEHAVWLHDEKSKRKEPARLLVVPLPAAQAERARQALQKRAKKKSKQVTADGLLLAGFVTLLTTLPKEFASAEAVLQWYRVRWQIELFFKRCKSLLGLQVVVSASDALLRVRLLGSMLVAALVDRLNEPALELAPQTPPSLWRWTQLHHLDLLRAVSGETPVETQHARAAEIEPLLRERPRKRLQAHALHQIRKIPNTRPRPDSQRKAA